MARANAFWPTAVVGEADSVNSVSASACHIGGPKGVSPGQKALLHGMSNSPTFPGQYAVLGHSILNVCTVVPGFRVLGFSVLPGFRALNPSNGAWSVHKTLFGFKAPLSKLLIENFLTIFSFLLEF